MRPKKRILLAGTAADELAVLRFTLATVGFSVASVENCVDLDVKLRRERFDLLICAMPWGSEVAMLKAAHKINPSMHTMIVGPTVNGHKFPADVVFGFVPPIADLIEKVRVLVLRQRGPHSLKKPALPVPMVIMPLVDARVKKLQGSVAA